MWNGIVILSYYRVPLQLVFVSNIIATSIHSAFSISDYIIKESYTFKAIISYLIIL